MRLDHYGHPTIAGFWTFCKEREAIRKRKESGMPPPWTKDEVLQTFFFCNVVRAHDKGTRWYVKNVATKELRGKLKFELLWKSILYRAVNSIEYFDDIGGVFSYREWMSDEREGIEHTIWAVRSPSNPAYIVLQGPDGRDRKEHLLDLLDWMGEHLGDLFDSINKAKTLREMWKLLQEVPYVGPFIALQVYRDLILVDALPFNDDDFTYLGPGARSGLKLFGFDRYEAQYLALQEIQRAHPRGLKLNLGDMEQAMCEYRKYCRLKEGKGRHRYYYHVAAD